MATTEKKSGEFVWHVFWAHNQEVDQMANLGAKGVKKVQMANEINGRRKATRGRWDGSAKSGGRSGCGVVVEGADRDRLVTVSKICGAISKRMQCPSRRNCLGKHQNRSCGFDAA